MERNIARFGKLLVALSAGVILITLLACKSYQPAPPAITIAPSPSAPPVTTPAPTTPAPVPPTPATPAPTITPTPLPSPTVKPTPTITASPSPPPVPIPPPAQNITINLSTQNIAFDTKTITVPAGANVTVVFNNKDAMPHNLAVYTNSSASTVIFRGDTITGPKIINYTFTAPATPGTYFFRCDVHPANMVGDFIVTVQ